MKKFPGHFVLLFVLALLIIRYLVWDNPLAESSLRYTHYQNSSNTLNWLSVLSPPASSNPENSSRALPAELLVSNLTAHQNITGKDQQPLHAWVHLRNLIHHVDGLPHAVEAIKEANDAWGRLMALALRPSNESSVKKGKEKMCPYSIREMNASSRLSKDMFLMQIPCGLVQGSSITIIGTPGSLTAEFRIELVAGAVLPGDPEAPIILHYNVRLLGDKLTDDAVIVQNTWTVGDEWGSEERCPPEDSKFGGKVDDLETCSRLVGKGGDQTNPPSNNSATTQRTRSRSISKRYFPFKQGYLAIAMLRVGVEGIHMTVDGKHVTSFAFRENLEPWLVNEVRITGDMQLLSVIASGLPSSEELEHVVDLEMLTAPPLPMNRTVELLIGIFSTANNFKRRMAVRRTWMQYDAVRSGNVAARFFVGLHKTDLVNEELWSEARTYGDIQLMPFVDYYALIPLKTIAICLYETSILAAKYVMKTDDDSFVRVDEMLVSLDNKNVSRGLLFGRITSDSQPQRDPESKWFVTQEEWPEESYPPWAHGPGYVVSRDIAEEVFNQHQRRQLKMFKLEDVAMGVWINTMRGNGINVHYVNEERIFPDGCEDGYVVAHYQEPRNMMCLWSKLQSTKQALCCRDRR